MKKIDLASLPAVWRQKITDETAENQPIEIPQSDDPKVNGNSHTTNPECQYRHERIVSKIEEDKRLKKPSSIQDFHNFCKVLVGELECCNKPKSIFDNTLTFIRSGKLDQMSSGYRAFYETHKDLVDRAAAVERKHKLMFKEVQEGKWSLVPIEYKSRKTNKTVKQRKDKGEAWLTPQRKKFYEKRVEAFATWLENKLAGNNKVKNNPTFLNYVRIALNHNSPHHKNIPQIYQPVLEKNFELLQNFEFKKRKLVEKVKSIREVKREVKEQSNKLTESLPEVQQEKFVKECKDWLSSQFGMGDGPSNPRLLNYIMSVYYGGNTIEPVKELVNKYSTKISESYVENGRLVPKVKKEQAFNHLTIAYDKLYEQNSTVFKLLKKTCHKYGLSHDDTLIQMIVAMDVRLSEMKSEIKTLQSTIGKMEKEQKSIDKTIDIKSFVSQLRDQSVDEFSIKFNSLIS